MDKFLIVLLITFLYSAFCFGNEQLPEAGINEQIQEGMAIEKVFGDAHGSAIAPATVIPSLLSVVPKELFSVLGIRGAASVIAANPGLAVGVGVITAGVIADQRLNDGVRPPESVVYL